MPTFKLRSGSNTLKLSIKQETLKIATTNMGGSVIVNNPDYVRHDGTIPLSGDWDVGDNAIENISNVSIGSELRPSPLNVKGDAPGVVAAIERSDSSVPFMTMEDTAGQYGIVKLLDNSASTTLQLSGSGADENSFMESKLLVNSVNNATMTNNSGVPRTDVQLQVGDFGDAGDRGITINSENLKTSSILFADDVDTYTELSSWYYAPGTQRIFRIGDTIGGAVNTYMDIYRGTNSNQALFYSKNNIVDQLPYGFAISQQHTHTAGTHGGGWHFGVDPIDGNFTSGYTAQHILDDIGYKITTNSASRRVQIGANSRYNLNLHPGADLVTVESTVTSSTSGPQVGINTDTMWRPGTALDILADDDNTYNNAPDIYLRTNFSGSGESGLMLHAANTPSEPATAATENTRAWARVASVGMEGEKPCRLFLGQYDEVNGFLHKAVIHSEGMRVGKHLTQVAASTFAVDGNAIIGEGINQLLAPTNSLVVEGSAHIGGFPNATGTYTGITTTYVNSDYHGMLTVKNYDDADASGGHFLCEVNLGGYNNQPGEPGSEIYPLVIGSQFGGLLESPAAGHMVVGIRNNEINDSFAVVSGGATAPFYYDDGVYDTLCFQTNSSGLTKIGGDLYTGHNITTSNHTLRLGAERAGTGATTILFRTEDSGAASYSYNSQIHRAGGPDGALVAEQQGTGHMYFQHIGDGNVAGTDSGDIFIRTKYGSGNSKGGIYLGLRVNEAGGDDNNLALTMTGEDRYTTLHSHPTNTTANNYFLTGYGIGNGTAMIRIGGNRQAGTAGHAYLDLVGDETYSSYGTRLLRTNAGANATSRLQHRGTGSVVIEALEALAGSSPTGGYPTHISGQTEFAYNSVTSAIINRDAITHTMGSRIHRGDGWGGHSLRNSNNDYEYWYAGGYGLDSSDEIHKWCLLHNSPTQSDYCYPLRISGNVNELNLDAFFSIGELGRNGGGRGMANMSLGVYTSQQEAATNYPAIKEMAKFTNRNYPDWGSASGEWSLVFKAEPNTHPNYTTYISGSGPNSAGTTPGGTYFYTTYGSRPFYFGLSPDGTQQDLINLGGPHGTSSYSNRVKFYNTYASDSTAETGIGDAPCPSWTASPHANTNGVFKLYFKGNQPAGGDMYAVDFNCEVGSIILYKYNGTSWTIIKTLS
jgi:hypothetical protein